VKIKKGQRQTLFFTLCAHKNEGHAEVDDKQSDLNHNNEAKKIDKKTHKKVDSQRVYQLKHLN